MRHLGLLIYHAIKRCQRPAQAAVTRRAGEDGDDDTLEMTGRGRSGVLSLRDPGYDAVHAIESAAQKLHWNAWLCCGRHYNAMPVSLRVKYIFLSLFDLFSSSFLALASIVKSTLFLKFLIDIITKSLVFNNQGMDNSQGNRFVWAFKIMFFVMAAEFLAMLFWKIKLKMPVMHTSRYFEEPAEAFYSFVALTSRLVALISGNPGNPQLNRYQALGYLSGASIYTGLAIKTLAFGTYHIWVSERQGNRASQIFSYIPFSKVLFAYTLFALDFYLPQKLQIALGPLYSELAKFGIAIVLAISTRFKISRERNVSRLIPPDDKQHDSARRHQTSTKYIAMFFAFMLTFLQVAPAMDAFMVTFGLYCYDSKASGPEVSDIKTSCLYVLLSGVLAGLAAAFMDVRPNYRPSLWAAQRARERISAQALVSRSGTFRAAQNGAPAQDRVENNRRKIFALGSGGGAS